MMGKKHSKLIPHHDFIIQARRDKIPEREIAKHLGVTRSAVQAYCKRNGLVSPRVRKPRMSLPFGAVSMRRDFTAAQLEHVERQAVAGGFATIAEYIVECARDKLSEEMER